MLQIARGERHKNTSLTAGHFSVGFSKGEHQHGKNLGSHAFAVGEPHKRRIKRGSQKKDAGLAGYTLQRRARSNNSTGTGSSK